MKSLLLTLSLFISLLSISQPAFNYSISVDPINVEGLSGIHSYAYATSGSKWLLIGGRLDGLHARQPFNAFPENQNNTELIVIDSETWQWWSRTIDEMEEPLREQLQSTNMNFAQLGDTLYIAGGYAFSSSANDHITFPQFTSILVSDLINAIINDEKNIQQYFQFITDDLFAVTGGQMKMYEDKIYLVGGHRFDGRYNPMGGPTYTQSYTNSIHIFEPHNTLGSLSISNLSSINDDLHLHRRDYNLLSDLTANNHERLIISSGVFQVGINSPYFYPVIIDGGQINPITSFNQYLSNYHTAHVSLKNTMTNDMHYLFFGGISNYYYQNGQLIQDDLVPFVKTISRLSRDTNDTFFEFVEQTEMPGYFGAGAEFILHPSVEISNNEVVLLNGEEQTPFVLGYVVGGIGSNTTNPFSINQTNQTWASSVIYQVTLHPTMSNEVPHIPGTHSFQFRITSSNQNNGANLAFNNPFSGNCMLYLIDAQGKLIQQYHTNLHESEYLMFPFSNSISSGTYVIHAVLNGTLHHQEKFIVLSNH